MSLSVDGAWKSGVWATTVWASGVWFEGVQPVVTTQTGAPSHAPSRRWSAQINGKFYYFNSLDELQHVLNSFKTKQKKKIAKRVTRTVIPVQLPHVEVPVHVPMWAAQEIQKVNASLEAYYWQQYQLLLDQDDEDAITVLYG